MLYDCNTIHNIDLKKKFLPRDNIIFNIEFTLKLFKHLNPKNDLIKYISDNDI